MKQLSLTEYSPFKEKVYSLWAKQYSRKEIAIILSANYDAVRMVISRGIKDGEITDQREYAVKKRFRMKWDKGLIWEEIE